MKNRHISIFMFAIIITSVFAQLPTYQLKSGWNMIGGDSETFSSTYIDTFSAVVPPIYTYDTERGRYQIAYEIEPLVGYWVLTTDTVTIREPVCDCPPTVTDIDGNVYETVCIGYKCWITENLKTTHYRDGTPIFYGDVCDEWSTLHLLEIGGHCAYNNHYSHRSLYGFLYNWYAVNSSHGLAPDGWHVPSDEEWKQLEKHLEMDTTYLDDIGFRGTNQGSQLAGNDTFWNHDALVADPEFNTTGFNALACGTRLVEYDCLYMELGTQAVFWTASSYDTTRAWQRALHSDYTGIWRNNSDKRYGLSIRCIKD